MRYNKLVRDRIPDIIIRSGDSPVTRILNVNEYKWELQRKLQEEVDEFSESGDMEELADILEVVYALAVVGGIGASRIEEMRKQKCLERGGFDRRIFLVGTIVNDSDDTPKATIVDRDG